MSREPLLFILGLVVAISPFVGLPLLWLSVLLPVCGLAIALIGFTLVRRKSQQQTIYEIPSPDVS